MSDYQPNVGDKVMVGGHGPYTVTNVAVAARAAHLNTEVTAATWVPFAWLTPAPEPEPDEPTAYGALVRDGDGRIWIHNPFQAAPDTPAWDAKDRLSTRWANIPRPITVVLADPAEVEALREKRDEFQRRINKAVKLVDDPGFWSTYSVTRQQQMRDILRGDS